MTPSKDAPDPIPWLQLLSDYDRIEKYKGGLYREYTIGKIQVYDVSQLTDEFYGPFAIMVYSYPTISPEKKFETEEGARNWLVKHLAQSSSVPNE